MSALGVALAGGVVGALGTVCAQAVFAWMRRPRLSFDFGGSPKGPPEATITAHLHGRRAAYLRLKVLNAGQRSARDVRVLVLTIEPLEGEPSNIATHPLKWADLDTDAVDIPPGVWRLIDVVHARTGDGEKRIGIWPKHDDIRWLLNGRRYRLVLALTATDIRTRFWELEVVFPARADWTDEEVWDLFGIESFREVPAPAV